MTNTQGETAADIVERLDAWRETPFEGDPMVDALLVDIPEAADEITRLRARVDELEKLLQFWADRKTVEEVLKGDRNDGWDNATPERRIEMMIERKHSHDEAVLAARAALHPTDEESRDA